MTYKDQMYCASPCANRECERHRDQVPKDTKGLPVSWGLFHVDCPGFVREIKHGR